MQTKTSGTFYRSGGTQSCTAEISVVDNTLTVTQPELTAHSYSLSELAFSDAIPGVPTEIRFPNGDLFVVFDANWRVSCQSGNTVSFLESNKLTVMLSLLLAPILIYWLIMVIMPAIASKSVDWLPDDVALYMGDQSFTVLENTFLEPSTLSKQQQNQIHKLFNNTLIQLDLSNKPYQVLTYHSPLFGANALALPNGTIVVTDDLVKQLNDYDETKFESMLIAILLHEIGHVEENHSLRLVAQSLANAIVFALLFGDLETVGELLIGASSSLMQSSFSRDMEDEADEYALQKLSSLGYSPSAFADAMASFDNGEFSDKDTNKILQYLSSHPAIQERIQKAKEYQ